MSTLILIAVVISSLVLAVVVSGVLILAIKDIIHGCSHSLSLPVGSVYKGNFKRIQAVPNVA